MTELPSQERLNAFIDGELAPADAERLLEQLRNDASLRAQLGQLRLAKDLVRHAYAGISPPEHRWRAPAAGPGGWRVAAGLAILGCGALLGWTARDPGLAPAGNALHRAEPGPATPAVESGRIVLHVSSASPEVALAALDRAEGIFEAARDSGRTVTVEIVANGGGLDLLRADRSVQAARIASLRAAHPGLTLVACGQTAQRLRESGVEVRLLPGTVTASSALDRIVLRMQQGWTYVKT